MNHRLGGRETAHLRLGPPNILTDHPKVPLWDLLARVGVGVVPGNGLLVMGCAFYDHPGWSPLIERDEYGLILDVRAFLRLVPTIVEVPRRVASMLGMPMMCLVDKRERL